MEEEIKSVMVHIPKQTWWFFKKISIVREKSMTKIMREILENYEVDNKAEENF